MLILLALFACSQVALAPPPLSGGALTTCLAGPESASPGDDLDVLIAGTVVGFDTGADMNLAACADGATVSVDIEDGDGQVWTVGWTVLDDSGADITPNLDLDLDDAVDLTFRWKLVWGTTAGFVLSDAEGLIAAADEGTWGGALSPGDVPGVEVQRGDYLGSTATDCQPIDSYSLDFVLADQTVTLVPLQIAMHDVDGSQVSLMSVNAMAWGESDQCSMSDSTDVTSWVAFR